ncbi:type I methionyl aminopeptidase [Pseudenhygromyxa sp. WMMC2535]|uniref:type I methionyl aminopeptidase n=1 Tax=Pseudenhygromyxa sp. WMMC2535 TaxID=2712867 RepID=UPI0015516DC3|nr:type I methionyl aminopeptidase [Pseudenhygromyxa sp. WMMC2535]NVB39137.1 type I methionyl aminopeptidase [Pseudenhygromyxa sp. WMMC2535]
MAIVIHGPDEIAKMRVAGQVAAGTLAYVASKLRAGVSTGQIDEWVREDTARRGAEPSQLGYKGFPASVCTSRNEVICHGIPNPKHVLQPGDIVNVDITSNIDGFHGDTSATFQIGEVSDAAKHVTDVCWRCLHAGIEVVRHGARLGDIGAAILEIANKEDCGVVEEFGGHGIGRKMHMPPHVSHVGNAGRGMRLREGMTFTIEPMITIGHPRVVILDDGWTAVTHDGTPTAQFEHTVLVTKTGYELMTKQVEPLPLVCPGEPAAATA